MNDCQALETNTQAPEVMQPGVRAFDDPAGLAKTAAVRLATPGDFGGDARGVQGLAVLVMVVATIGLNDVGLGQRATTLAADRGNGLDQRQKLGDIVAIGAGQDERERDALRFGNEMVLGAGASAISGVRSRF